MPPVKTYLQRLIRSSAERLTVALLLRLFPTLSGWQPGDSIACGMLQVSEAVGLVVLTARVSEQPEAPPTRCSKSVV